MYIVQIQFYHALEVNTQAGLCHLCKMMITSLLWGQVHVGLLLEKRIYLKILAIRTYFSQLLSFHHFGFPELHELYDIAVVQVCHLDSTQGCTRTFAWQASHPPTEPRLAHLGPSRMA